MNAATIAVKVEGVSIDSGNTDISSTAVLTVKTSATAWSPASRSTSST